MRVAIREFCRRTDQTVPNGVGPFSRCVFESLALAYRRRIRELIDITGRPIERIHIVGGGSRNRLLCEMTADACGIPVVAGPSEATAIGNLLVQGIAAGAVEGIAEGRRILRNSFTPVEHEPSYTELWEMASEKFDTMCN
jgi:rhamnulokinase